jgi:hypothetical protein
MVMSPDYADGPETRQWTKPAFERLATLKNSILQYGLDHGYDFVWLVDADVMVDPGTLQSLLDSYGLDDWRMVTTYVGPIVAGVYWTLWQNPQYPTTQKVHAGPQVWLTHPYGLSGRGWTESGFRHALISRQRLPVGGLGACTLIPRSAIEKGVSFAPFDGLPPGPMSEGEDRHFCAWATSKHVPLIADAWVDIYHAYHPHEYPQLPERVAALHYYPMDPKVGTLVSAKVELLEPVIDPSGRAMLPRPQWVRGTFGALPVLPQIEEAIGSLTCGASRLINLQYPSWWKDPQLRLTGRTAKVTLYDVKPQRLPPVIDTEILFGRQSKRIIDTTTLTRDQVMALA